MFLYGALLEAIFAYLGVVPVVQQTSQHSVSHNCAAAGRHGCCAAFHHARGNPQAAVRATDPGPVLLPAGIPATSLEPPTDGACLSRTFGMFPKTHPKSGCLPIKNRSVAVNRKVWLKKAFLLPHGSMR